MIVFVCTCIHSYDRYYCNPVGSHAGGAGDSDTQLTREERRKRRRSRRRESRKEGEQEEVDEEGRGVHSHQCSPSRTQLVTEYQRQFNREPHTVPAMREPFMPHDNHGGWALIRMTEHSNAV